MTKDFMVFRPSKRRVFVRARYSLFICCTCVVELFVGLSDENVPTVISLLLLSCSMKNMHTVISLRFHDHHRQQQLRP